MSAKRRIVETLLAPVVAMGASLGARYVAKNGPEFVEKTLLPWLREATNGAGGVVEKVPEVARSAVSTGGDLAEGLTDRVRDVTGGGSASGGSSAGSGGSKKLSREQLSERSEERAKRRAERRKATKGR